MRCDSIPNFAVFFLKGLMTSSVHMKRSNSRLEVEETSQKPSKHFSQLFCPYWTLGAENFEVTVPFEPTSLVFIWFGSNLLEIRTLYNMK